MFRKLVGSSTKKTKLVLPLYQRLGGEDALRKGSEAFYERVFVDPLLKEFVEDANPSHAIRLHAFLIEHLGGEPLYTRLRGPNLLQRITDAHDFAISCHRRPEHKIGRAFTVEEARRWIYLFFYSMREARVGTADRKSYRVLVKFIKDAMGSYVADAAKFAKVESVRAIQDCEKHIKDNGIDETRQPDGEDTGTTVNHTSTTTSPRSSLFSRRFP